jgi:hypothetical protein
LSFADADENLESEKARLPTPPPPAIEDLDLEEGAVEAQPVATVEAHARCRIQAAVARDAKQIEKVEEDAPAPFNIAEIPSPTRNRAKRQQALLEAMAQTEVEQQQEAEIFQDVLEEPAQEFHDVEDKPALEEIDADAEAARLREAEEMALMDEQCVESFLESVKRVSWRGKVRTPIKGSNLYTKFMRPCRPMGTSVDVKDSSFKSLGFFLQFLESEGLVHLQPGLTDPVVTDINFEACRKYKYVAKKQPFALTPSVLPPHNPGCCCRRCINAAPTPPSVTCASQCMPPAPHCTSSQPEFMYQ